MKFTIELLNDILSKREFNKAEFNKIYKDCEEKFESKNDTESSIRVFTTTAHLFICLVPNEHLNDIAFLDKRFLC